MIPARILTLDEVVAHFGDPTPYILPTGEISPAWEREILDKVELPAPLKLLGHSTPVTRFRCHRRLAAIYRKLLQAVYAEPEVWASIGDWGGCYNFRTVRGAPGKPSRHSWAICHDWDVADNPMGGGGKVHPRLLEISAAHGFFYGGAFKGKRRDPMHWEFAAPWLLDGGRP